MSDDTRQPVASWTAIDPNTGETLTYETFVRSEFDPPPPGEIVETLHISTRVEVGCVGMRREAS